MKPWAREFALALLLTTALSSGAGRIVMAADGPQQLLLDKANYWRLKDRPDLALQALNQLLAIDPKQPEALFQAGVLSVQQGKTADAQRYLERLRQVAPDNSRVADLENTIRTGKVAPNDLAEARRLAQAGQLPEAVEKYQQTFKGAPPSGFGVEYYTTLAGTPEGWEEARTGLTKLSQASPNDRQVKLALGKVLTYREPTRAEGISLLASLAKDSVVGADARRAWRDALTWSGGSPAAKRQYQQYLAEFPQDAEIQQLAKEASTPAPGAAQGGGGGGQSPGYADLNRGRLGPAEHSFQRQLRANRNDADALAGLGLVRLRQQRFGEARELLGRAMRASPENRRKLATAYDSASFWGTVQQAKALSASGRNQQARALLVSLLNRSHADNWGAEMVLAGIDAKLGDHAGAEQAYRRVLRARPGNRDATAGLINELRAQNRADEAQRMTYRLSPAEQARLAEGGGGGAGSQAEALRNAAKEAAASGDRAGAIARFNQAIADDPRNPWIRLDFARFLAGEGQVAQAYQVVDPRASGNTATSILVAAMFDTQQNRWSDALDRIEQVPPGQRNQEIANFRDRVLVRGTIERAQRLAAQGNRAGARDMLVALYTNPNVRSGEKREIPDILYKLGYAQTALQITHDAAARGGPDAASAEIDYAWLLLRTGHDPEAAMVVKQLEESGGVGAANQDDYLVLKANVAAKQADKLRVSGDLAGAYDQIGSLLAQRPNDVTLLMAVGRMYASAGRSADAMVYFQRAYDADPTNIDVIRGAVGGAIQAHDYEQAENWLNQGMAAFPNNPRLYVLRAEVARARGDNRQALQDLAVARSLAGTGLNPTPVGAAGLPGPAAMPAPPPNPFRRSDAAPAAGGWSVWSLLFPPAAAATLPRGTTPALAAVSADSDDIAGTGASGTSVAQMPPPDAPAPLNLGPEPAPMPLSAPPNAVTAIDMPPPVPPVSAQVEPTPAGPAPGRPGPVGPMPLYAPAATISAVPPVPPPVPPPPALAPPVTLTGPVPETVPPVAAEVPAESSAGPDFGFIGNLFYGNATPMQAAFTELLVPGPINGYLVPLYTPLPAAGETPSSEDSLELDIARNMQAIEAETATMLAGGLSFRIRDGISGLSFLTEVGTPIEARWSPGYNGVLRFAVVPTYLDAGSIDTANLGSFGANPILAALGAPLVNPGNQDAAGVGLLGSYTYGPVSAQLGTTPLGFPITNLVGGVAFQPKLFSDLVSLRLEGFRSPITDTLLSYAGTRTSLGAANALTGGAFGGRNTWGGVTRNGGRATITYDDTYFGAYAGGGAAALVGTNVPENGEIQGILGAYIRPYKSGDDTLRTGVQLFYVGYDRDLSHFTFGQGGYFSPRNYEALTFPVEYTGRSGRWAYLGSVAVGVQHFNGRSSPYFPQNPSAQAQLVATGATATFSGTSATSPAFNLRGQLEYALRPGLVAGAAAGFDNGRDYTEGSVKLYLRQTFGAAEPAPVLPTTPAGGLPPARLPPVPGSS